MRTIIVWSKQIVTDRSQRKLDHGHLFSSSVLLLELQRCRKLFFLSLYCICLSKHTQVLVISDDLKFMLGVLIKHCIWIGIIYSLSH